MRITVCAVWLMSATVHEAPAWASLPEGVRVAPYGMGWIFAALPPTPSLARGLYLVVLSAAVLGLVGLLSRLSLSVLTLGGAYLMAIPQLSGTIFHDHHLVWLAALLAASPAGDALSVDAWLHRRRRGSLPSPAPSPTPSPAYGLPIRAAWLLIGMIFFFPGLWKLIESGPAWIFSDNLRNQMWWKWAQMPDLTPALRVDRHPWLLRLGALMTVLFELSFLPLIFWKPARPWLLAAALLFHQATAYFMGIRFASLWLCYAVFVDWEALRIRLFGTQEQTEERGRRLLAPALVASLLGATVFAFGATGTMQAWPFACYPTFQWMARESMPTLVVEVVREDGSAEEIPRAAMIAIYGNQRYWGLAWSLGGAMEGITGQRADPERLRAFWEALRASPEVRSLAEGATEVRFVAGDRSVDPDRPEAPLEGRRVLHRIALQPEDSPQG
jgi:hypothetical protein